MDSFFQPDVFKSNLQETIIWCKNRLDVSNTTDSLGTLGPDSEELRRIYKVAIPQDYSFLKPLSDKIFYKRKQNLGERKPISLPDKVNLQNGIIIIFSLDHAFAYDGIANEESNGFFGLHQLPVWDTWIYYVTKEDIGYKGLSYVSHHIISWVPEQFIIPVKKAMSLNIDGSIFELSDGQKFAEKNPSFEYLKLIDDLIEY